MPQRLISFAGTSLAIEYTGRRASKVVDFLFRHIAGSEEAAAPHVSYHLHTDDEGALVLTRNDKLLCSEKDDAVLAERLLGDSSFDLADRVCDGLLFHAAGLVTRGQGLLLAGPSGTGKTTLSTYLFTQCFDFLSDEFIFVPDGKGKMQGLTRPLNIKKPARKGLKQYVDFDSKADAMLMGRISYLIPTEVLRFDNRPDPVHANLLIFPRYIENGDFDCRPIPKAKAALELMKCLLNARNLSAHGFHAISTLVQQVPAYALHYSNFDQIEQQIGRLLEQ